MNRPTQLTFLRILLTPVIVVLLFQEGLTVGVAAFVVFIVASLTDWYDGHIARKYGEVSTWGKFLDPLADKILVLSVFTCFSLMGYIPVWMVIVIIIRDVSMTALRSYTLIKGNVLETHFLAKMKTCGQVGLLYLIFINHLVVLGYANTEQPQLIVFVREYHVLIILMFLITLITVISYIVYIVINKLYVRQMISDIYRIFIPSDV